MMLEILLGCRFATASGSRVNFPKIPEFSLDIIRLLNNDRRSETFATIHSVMFPAIVILKKRGCVLRKKKKTNTYPRKTMAFGVFVFSLLFFSCFGLSRLKFVVIDQVKGKGALSRVCFFVLKVLLVVKNRQQRMLFAPNNLRPS